MKRGHPIDRIPNFGRLFNKEVDWSSGEEWEVGSREWDGEWDGNLEFGIWNLGPDLNSGSLFHFPEESSTRDPFERTSG
jgi:hypothetical protein